MLLLPHTLPSTKLADYFYLFFQYLPLYFKVYYWISLVAQWLRICLPMLGTQVRALVQEDATCCRATKPMRHNYWACTLEPVSHNYWACVPQLLKPTCLEPVFHNKRSHRNEKPAHPHSLQLENAHVQQRRNNADKNK